jgi:Rieske Fe-S protein
MKATVTKVKNPFENISRRSALGVLGVGMTGVFVACNDDISPLKLSLKSDATGEITAAGSVMLTATVGAGMADTIEFYESTPSSDLLLDSVTSKPLTVASKSITYTAADNGTHTYFGKVTSMTGKDAPSNPVVVKVNIATAPVLPTISLAASSNSFTTNGSLVLTATAATPSGSVSSVEFFDGTKSLGVVSAAPFTKTIALTTTDNGTHSYTAKVTDSNGGTATSTPAVAVTVTIPAPLPTITLAASSNAITAAGNLTLTATVAGGTVTQVEFFDGTTSLGMGVLTGTSYTKTIAFTATSPALSHDYSAKGTVAGVVAPVVSNTVNVNVNIGNQAPTVTLLSSSNNVIANGSITLTATATAKTGTISSVEFFDGATSLGVVTAPTAFTKTIAFTATNNGAHSYTAKATDSSGNSATSTPAVAVTVNIPATPPTITLAAAPTSVTAAGSSTLTATVTPGSGTITKVEFFEGATLLGTDTTGPSYTFAPAYTSANNGTHTYTAKVTASDGSTATSTTASVIVNIAVTAGTLIALFTALPTAGSYVNFNHPTSGIKCLLYRAPSAQTGGVSNAGAFYVAYSRKCTHAGTIITQNPNTATPHVLTCQDHGATYNMDSNCAPINGIAPTALPTIAIKVGTDGIYI